MDKRKDYSEMKGRKEWNVTLVLWKEASGEKKEDQGRTESIGTSLGNKSGKFDWCEKEFWWKKRTNAK